MEKQKKLSEELATAPYSKLLVKSIPGSNVSFFPQKFESFFEELEQIGEVRFNIYL